MIAHVTIGAQHLILRDPEAGQAAMHALEDGADCPTCGRDLWGAGTIVGPRHDARAGLSLRCSCGCSWRIKRGDPLEASS